MFGGRAGPVKMEPLAVGDKGTICDPLIAQHIVSLAIAGNLGACSSLHESSCLLSRGRSVRWID